MRIANCFSFIKSLISSINVFHTMATTGPDMMYSTSLGKKGLELRSL